MLLLDKSRHACARRADSRPESAPESQADDSAATGTERDHEDGQARPALREAPGRRLHALLRPFPLVASGIERQSRPAQIRQSGAPAGVPAAERQGCHIGHYLESSLSMPRLTRTSAALTCS